MNHTARTFFRYLASLAVLAGGLLHLRIWNSTYRPIPSGSLPGVWVVKDGFPLQAAVSVVLAGLLLFVRRPTVWLAAIVMEIGSIVALVLSRQASIFGWKETGWGIDPKEVVVVEAVAVIALALTLIFDSAHHDAENDLATL